MKHLLKIFWEGKIGFYRIIFISIIFNLILIDQISKYLIRFYLEKPIKITRFFEIIFVENTGVAFSISIAQEVIFLLAFGVVVYLFSFLWKKSLTKLSCLSYILIIAGAIGNIVDRIIYDSVTDFLAFWSFPVFNFADIFIFCGVAVLFWEEVKKK